MKRQLLLNMLNKTLQLKLVFIRKTARGNNFTCMELVNDNDRRKIRRHSYRWFLFCTNFSYATPKRLFWNCISMINFWWKFYQPLGFSIATEKHSIVTKADLASLCESVDEYGTKEDLWNIIYVNWNILNKRRKLV